MSKASFLRGLRALLLVIYLSLLVVLTVFASLLCYLVGGIGLAFVACAVGLIAAVWIVRTFRYGAANLFELTALLALVGLAIAVLLPAVQRPPRDRRMGCFNNLKQIALGIHYYHDTYKVLPAAYIHDGKGQAIRSWRVLLLPFVEQQAVYARYDFHAAWDSEHNRQLVEPCPPLYRCPQARDEAAGDTQYFVIVGDETPWPPQQARSFQDVADGSANTLAVVESHGRGVKWTEPRDLAFDRMPWKINPTPPAAGFSSAHPGGATAAMMDGSVRFISEKIDEPTLRALATSEGGEVVGEF